MTTPAKSNFVFALENWTMAEFREWSAMASSNDEEPNYKRQAELAGKAIISWPFIAKPNEVETWENIKVTDWAAVLKALTTAVKGLFAEGN